MAIAPFIGFLAARFLGLNGNAFYACIIEGAMPTMIVLLLIAARFKLDESLSAFMIVATTAVSFLTLPVIVYMTNQ